MSDLTKPCDDCNGTGSTFINDLPDLDCFKCNGTGKVKDPLPNEGIEGELDKESPQAELLAEANKESKHGEV